MHKSDVLALAHSGMLSLDHSDHKSYPGSKNLSRSSLQSQWPLFRKMLRYLQSVWISSVYENALDTVPKLELDFFFQVTSKLAELPSVSFLFLGFCSVKLYSSILEEV